MERIAESAAISIHALREEGDQQSKVVQGFP